MTINIKAGSYTPLVFFTEETGVFEISGRSFPENAKIFYVPVLDWINSFTTESQQLICKINLEYFNTASSKFLLEIFYAFQKKQQELEVPVTIEWVYQEDDDDMKEAGEEFAQIVKLPFIYTEEKN